MKTIDEQTDALLALLRAIEDEDARNTAIRHVRARLSGSIVTDRKRAALKQNAQSAGRKSGYVMSQAQKDAIKAGHARNKT